MTRVPTVLWRALFIWLLLAAAEVVHGALRVRFLNRRLGDKRARQLGVFSGSVLILAIVWYTISWSGARTLGQLLGVGLLWLLLMLAFDIAFGRLVFRASWDRIAADFNPRRGGWLGLGMLVLFIAPWLVAKLKGLI